MDNELDNLEPYQEQKETSEKTPVFNSDADLLNLRLKKIPYPQGEF